MPRNRSYLTRKWPAAPQSQIDETRNGNSPVQYDGPYCTNAPQLYGYGMNGLVNSHNKPLADNDAARQYTRLFDISDITVGPIRSQKPSTQSRTVETAQMFTNIDCWGSYASLADPQSAHISPVPPTSGVSSSPLNDISHPYSFLPSPPEPLFRGSWGVDCIEETDRTSNSFVPFEMMDSVCPANHNPSSLHGETVHVFRTHGDQEMMGYGLEGYDSVPKSVSSTKDANDSGAVEAINGVTSAAIKIQKSNVATEEVRRVARNRRKYPDKMGAYVCKICGHDFTAAHNLKRELLASNQLLVNDL
ncbi:hypothetical protein VKT23_009106 [Stygiomarasmius scandens]|uniref:C2H2-type domain-containing protein n=1 Tax=Marasmiellus scandens TaxID=2682957 RepID=A0ABR1JIL1_9AGAR